MTYRPSILYFSLFLAASLGAGCSVMATRPVQEMADTAAAIRAAREAQAEATSPDYFREANEWYSKARREYKYKNFHEAQEYARKARRYAEQAEFEAIKKTAVQTAPNLPRAMDSPPVTYSEPAPTSSASAWTAPTPTLGSPHVDLDQPPSMQASPTPQTTGL